MFTVPEKLSVPQYSLIREVAERGSKIPGFISFALGNPAREGIPIELLQRCAREVFEETPMPVLQYGPAVGDAALRKWIVERVTTKKGCPVEGQKVVMLTGSGKALGYAARAFCSEGDEAFCDEFSFPNGYNSMKNAGVTAIGIPSDEKGMIPEELAKQAARGKGKYIYLIPNFQNPMGSTIPLDRRKELYEVACKYDLIIYEDDPYGDVRFSGEEVPTFKSFDTENRVVYVGSFSKTLSAGLRVGYMYGPEKLMDLVTMVKGSDGQDPLFNQFIIRKCLQNIDFEAHLQNIRVIYKRKCDLMANALKADLDPSCKILVPNGGMFMWVELPEGVDVNAVSESCISAGVGPVKSEAFAVDPSRPGHAFRLNFSAVEDEDIPKGIKIFSEIVNAAIKSAE